MKTILLFISVLAYQLSFCQTDIDSLESPPDLSEVAIDTTIYINDSLEVKSYFKCIENREKFESEKECGTSSFLQFFFKNFKYPEKAKELKVSGKILIEFIVEKNGFVSNVKIKEDICEECGVDAKTAIEKTNVEFDPPFIPGYFDGVPVRTIQSLPIHVKPNK